MNDNVRLSYREPTSVELLARIPPRESAPAGFVDVTHWRGHRLPLRLELAFDDVGRAGDYWHVIDQDHRVVAIPGDFEQLRLLVEDANNSMARRFRCGTVIRATHLTVPERLSWLHPCDRHQARIGLAFECLASQRYTHWIDRWDLFQLQGVGVLNADLTPKKVQIQRFHDWRVAENAALRRHKML